MDPTLSCTFDDDETTFEFGNDDGDGWIRCSVKLKDELVVNGEKAVFTSEHKGSYFYETKDRFINPNDYIGMEVRLGKKLAVIEWEGEPPAKRRKRKVELYVVSWYTMGYKPSRTNGGVYGVFGTWNDAMTHALKVSDRPTAPTEDSSDACVIDGDLAYWWCDDDTRRVAVNLQFMS